LRRKTRQLVLAVARMTMLQDEERRRIARSCMDSVGQPLAAIEANSVLVEAESH
jgi:signal transduction histidine kinase